MSFVDNFLEATATLPRKVVRILKLYLTVEQRAKNVEDNLKILREKYLKDLKEDKIENSEFILYTNEKYYKELLNLSDYKQNLIDELKYILKYKFINKIEQIIERGQLQEILNNKKPNMEKKEEKLLNKKTKRDTEIIIDDIENQEEKPYNPEEDKNLYCKCNQRSSGRMIMCDVCHKWFHRWQVPVLILRFQMRLTLFIPPQYIPMVYQFHNLLLLPANYLPCVCTVYFLRYR